LTVLNKLPTPETFTEHQYFREFLKAELFIAERKRQYELRKLFNLKLHQKVLIKLNLLSRFEEAVISFEGTSQGLACIVERISIKLYAKLYL